jgi:hypothetical protein
MKASPICFTTRPPGAAQPGARWARSVAGISDGCAHAHPVGTGPTRGRLHRGPLGHPGDARPPDGDAFRSHWLRHQVRALFVGVDPARGELTVETRCGDEPSTLIAAAGRVPFIPGSVPEPDVVLTGPLNGVVGLVA